MPTSRSWNAEMTSPQLRYSSAFRPRPATSASSSKGFEILAALRWAVRFGSQADVTPSLRQSPLCLSKRALRVNEYTPQCPSISEVCKRGCRTHDANFGIGTLARRAGGRLPIDKPHRSVGRRREHRFHREARFQLVGSAVHEIADHAHARRIAELDQHDGVGRFGLEARRLAAMDDRPREHLALRPDRDPFEPARAAIRASQARRPVMARAIAAALDLKLALVGAAPELAVVDILAVRQWLGRLRAHVGQ